MRMPTISTEGQASCVEFGFLTVWFSYETVIAFQVNGGPRVVSRNYWSKTTGKHLNAIDGGNQKNRVDAETFETLWNQAVHTNGEQV
jgi:hypothetical protein